jgi:hypothetical protein
MNNIIETAGVFITLAALMAIGQLLMALTP